LPYQSLKLGENQANSKLTNPEAFIASLGMNFLFFIENSMSLTILSVANLSVFIKTQHRNNLLLKAQHKTVKLITLFAS
jgi:hypothetical protein